MYAGLLRGGKCYDIKRKVEVVLVHTLCVSVSMAFPPSVTDYCQAFKTALWVNLKINSLKNVDIYSPS